MILKNIKHYILLLLFLVISFLFINPMARKARSQFHSSQLKKVTVKDENTERTDYFDSNGQITIAANLGYATVIITKTENSKLEKYYDDKGEPISRYNGYDAVLQDYDERGRNNRITYLNRDGEPIIMANGYAIEEREFNPNGQIAMVRYLDNQGKPVNTPLYGYGQINEYDENGRNCRIIYINNSGEPAMTGLGYAIVSRHFYESEGPENSKVESEFYFNEHGEPISLSLGQYGVHKEYDEYDRQSVWTYLDAEGKPMVTNKGYTTVRRTFQANNSVATERYFDLDGNPFSLSEGQYGVKTEEGQIIYLNENGADKFNLKNLLYNQSLIAIILAMVVVVLSVYISKKLNVLFLIIYVCAIAYLTLMFRESGEAQIKLELFWSYRKIFIDSETRAGILRNIWLFVPLGTIIYKLFTKKPYLLILIAFSILIEIVQYFTGTGLCELDDVISNSIGGAIGFGAGKMISEMKYKLRNRGHSGAK